MDRIYGDAPDWVHRSGWSLSAEIKRHVKQRLARVPGRLGSALRCRLYGFAAQGSDVYICEEFWAEYPAHLSLGNHVSVNRGCFINAGGGVTLSDWVLIGPRVTIYSQNHDTSRTDVPIALLPDVRAAVHIGEGAWLGAGSTVLAGVHVGAGAVVAAGAVVTRDVPAFAIVGGVPARVIRYRAGVEAHSAQTTAR